MNIARPEYKGDAPHWIMGGDLIALNNPDRREYYVVKWDDGENWVVDHVRLNFETRQIEVTIENDRVWKGCVYKVKRTRVEAFKATGHDPFFRTPEEIEEWKRRKGLA